MKPPVRILASKFNSAISVGMLGLTSFRQRRQILAFTISMPLIKKIRLGPKPKPYYTSVVLKLALKFSAVP